MGKDQRERILQKVMILKAQLVEFSLKNEISIPRWVNSINSCFKENNL